MSAMDSACRVRLGTADVVNVVQHLPLQVGQVHHVAVNDAQGAHTGGGQVEGGGRAEAAGAHDDHPGVEQLALALAAHLGQDDVAA